jgi:hypothetical protein
LQRWDLSVKVSAVAGSQSMPAWKLKEDGMAGVYLTQVK